MQIVSAASTNARAPRPVGVRSRLVALHRFLAMLALSAIVVGCLEPLIAEAHDGDAASSVMIGPATADGTRAPAEPGPPAHEMHLCHCTHAHGASARCSAEVSVVVLMVEETAPRRPLMAPSSVTLDGLMRPPAATRG